MSTGFLWGFAFKADDGLWYFLEQNGPVSGNTATESLSEVTFLLKLVMFDNTATEDLSINFDDITPDEELDTSSPVQMIVNWGSDAELDLNAVLFDSNAN